MRIATPAAGDRALYSFAYGDRDNLHYTPDDVGYGRHLNPQEKQQKRVVQYLLHDASAFFQGVVGWPRAKRGIGHFGLRSMASNPGISLAHYGLLDRTRNLLHVQTGKI